MSWRNSWEVEAEDIDLSGKPAVILMAGLQGSGKTTHTGKVGSIPQEQTRPSSDGGGLRRLPSCRDRSVGRWLPGKWA